MMWHFGNRVAKLRIETGLSKMTSTEPCRGGEFDKSTLVWRNHANGGQTQAKLDGVASLCYASRSPESPSVRCFLQKERVSVRCDSARTTYEASEKPVVARS
jgi:hypothetical protein